MTCRAPLKCWAACQVHTQALSTATIRSLFFFLRVLEGVSAEQKLSDDKQNRGWCCCHSLAVNAPGLTAGARHEGTENGEAKRSGERAEWKFVNPVTSLNRTIFFSVRTYIPLYQQISGFRVKVFRQRALKWSQSSSELEYLSFNRSSSRQHLSVSLKSSVQTCAHGSWTKGTCVGSKPGC